MQKTANEYAAERRSLGEIGLSTLDLDRRRKCGCPITSKNSDQAVVSYQREQRNRTETKCSTPGGNSNNHKKERNSCHFAKECRLQILVSLRVFKT